MSDVHATMSEFIQPVPTRHQSLNVVAQLQPSSKGLFVAKLETAVMPQARYAQGASRTLVQKPFSSLTV